MTRRLALLLSLAALAAAPARAAAAPTYYLALGDSLAAGTQPGLLFTKLGYANQLLPLLRTDEPTLQLVNLGCPDETSTSLIEGGGCSYEHGTQLAEALAFLVAHRQSTSLVTIDVGANDLLRCGTADEGCLRLALQTVGESLERILRELRSAAPRVRIVGIAYYDALLGDWLAGRSGMAAARASLAGVDALNALERRVYSRHAARVAAVDEAFSTSSSTPLVQLGKRLVPTNVAVVCRWTWSCARGDVHPNRTGYGVIARAIRDALAS